MKSILNREFDYTPAAKSTPERLHRKMKQWAKREQEKAVAKVTPITRAAKAAK